TMEDGGSIGAAAAESPLEDGPEGRRERQHPARRRFGAYGVEAHDAAGPIDLGPGELGDFPASPAGVVGDIENVLIGWRQVRADGTILGEFEEALTRRIFAQPRREDGD